MFDTLQGPPPPDLSPLGTDNPHQIRQVELIERMRELAAGIHVLEAELCEVMADVEREGWFALWGAKSTADFVSYATGCSISRAKRQVAVGVAMEAMPTVAGCMKKGELSVDQAHSIASVVTPENEPVLARWAHECTPSQLQRICSSYKKALSSDDEEAVRWTRHLTYGFGEDSFFIHGRLSNEEGSIFKLAMDAAWENVPREAEHREVEALVAMADAYLGGAQDGRPGGDRYNINLHIDMDEDGALVSHHGARFSDAALSRFLCDCSTVTILERNGETIDIGRKTRVVSTSQRRAMEKRDKGCRFPGCTAIRRVDAHHVEIWTEGGLTNLINLLSLCPFHHHLVHEGGYKVFLNAENQIEFRDTWGNLIPAVIALEAPESIDLAVDPSTCESKWDGEPMDYGLIVSVMIDGLSMAGGPAP